MENTRILITGGTGSLGQELVRFFVDRGWKVTSISKDAHKIFYAQRINPKVRYVQADICDFDTILKECEGQDFVVHAAASKIISVAEKNVSETIRVNVTGTQVVARACERAMIRNALFISSDKACEPLNAYGRSKSLGEDIFTSYGYAVLRYGNVVGTKSSFVDVWANNLALGKPIMVREPIPTRFFLRVRDAVALVDDALGQAHSAVFIPLALHSFSVMDVARAIRNTSSLPGELIKQEPLQEGEKQHEVLLAHNEWFGGSVSPLLGTVLKSRGSLSQSQFNRSQFSSETAPRMSGEEVLKKIGWERHGETI